MGMNDTSENRSGHEALQGKHVDLCIEELVLHGFPEAERYLIGDDVEAELARLMTEGRGLRMPDQDKMIPRISGGPIAMGAGQRSESAGAKIAQSVYGAIQQRMNSGSKK